MAAGKLIGLDEAAALVPDGARLGIGGVLLRRKPIALLEALAAAGTHDLRIYSFLASLDVELLVRSGSVAEVHSGYVGFEQLGFAPAYSDALSDGRVLAFEYSEFLFVAGLRASLAGLPFLPTRGARGSDLVAELGIAEVTCPYSGDVLLAAPALRPDVCMLHAEAADEHGNVLAPTARDFLFDADQTLARASERVVVSVERIVPTDELRGRTLLHAFEVDAVVEARRGAWPTGLPGVYGADLEAVRARLSPVGP